MSAITYIDGCHEDDLKSAVTDATLANVKSVTGSP